MMTLQDQVKKQLGNKITLPLRLVCSGPETIIWNSTLKGVETEVNFSSRKLEITSPELIASLEEDLIVLRNSNDLDISVEFSELNPVITFCVINSNTLAIATDDGKLKIWDIEKNTEIKEFTPESKLSTQGSSGRWISAILLISKDEVILGFSTGDLSLFNLKSGSTEYDYFPQKNEIIQLLFARKDRFISTSRDGYIKIWNIREDQALITIDTSPVAPEVVILLDHVYLLMEGNLNLFQVFDTTSGLAYSEFGKRISSNREIYSVIKLERRGRRTFSVGYHSGKVAIWNMKGEKFEEFNWNTGEVEALLELPIPQSTLNLIFKLLESLLPRGFPKLLLKESITFL